MSSANPAAGSSSSAVAAPADATTAAAATAAGIPLPAGTKYVKRKRFEHGGRLVYEWEQDIEQVEMWITPPPGVTAKMIQCTITDHHFTLGIKGNPPFIDEDLHATVVVSESFWMMEDGVLHINFQKASLAETWPAVLKGHANLNSAEQEQETQKILLERFQREHPGFDFSQATFSGQAPDPKSFLGGFDTSKIRGR